MKSLGKTLPNNNDRDEHRPLRIRLRLLNSNLLEIM